MREISLKALAKINLALDVTGQREDGYHLVRMIMQTIHLYDRIEITKKNTEGIEVKTNLSFLPTNENNLVWKAAKLLIDEFRLTGGLRVWIGKRIPVAAGLAGGSTDAAAMLYGMNELYGLGLSREKLMEFGLKVGADVPFCLLRGTALAEGIGEELTALSPMVKCPVLIAKPAISVSTKTVYRKLSLGENTRHPDVDQMIADIQARDLKAITADMGNVLEDVTIPDYPVIRQIKEKMMESGALGAMMTGSGPTVFGIFEEQETAERAYEEMRGSGLAKQIHLTTIYNNRRA